MNIIVLWPYFSRVQSVGHCGQQIPMHVLVLGGAGFIGSNIVERLLNDGTHSVTIGDIVDDKVAHLEEHPNYRFVKLDITEASEELENEILGSDVVMNLAAIVHPSLYVSKPLAVFELNFQVRVMLY